MDNSDSEGATCSTESENLASILQSSLLVDEFRKICAPVSNVDSSKKTVILLQLRIYNLFIQLKHILIKGEYAKHFKIRYQFEKPL